MTVKGRKRCEDGGDGGETRERNVAELGKRQSVR
jgi:hypothetical protein